MTRVGSCASLLLKGEFFLGPQHFCVFKESVQKGDEILFFIRMMRLARLSRDFFIGELGDNGMLGYTIISCRRINKCIQVSYNWMI